MKRIFQGVLLFILLASIPSVGHALPSSDIPLNSSIYPALDKLVGWGLVESSLQGDRPFSRLEAARQIFEAEKKLQLRFAPPAIHQLIRRLQATLADALVEVEGQATSSYFKPLRRAELSYVYQEGEPLALVGVAARQFPLNYNNFGLDYREYHNGQLLLAAEMRLGPLLLDWQPITQIQEGGEDADASFRTLQGKVALGLGLVEVSAGRQSLWWGQGRHGTLLLTNNAKPLDMLRVTNPSPVLLPWVFKFLGPFRFDAFWSRLEKDRTIPEPYFAGLRFDFKPLPILEIGAARTVMFGGEGRPDVDFSEFLTILGGKNLEGGADTSNSLAALDARVRLPFFWNAEFYGELGGEDEADSFIANTAYLVGLYLPRIEPSGRASLRLEYADLSRLDNNSPPWYRHGIYRSGYTYDGKILGHHVGGAGKDLFAELRLMLPGAVTLSLSVNEERRGSDQPVIEKHLQSSMNLEWSIGDNLSLQGRYAFDRVDNLAYHSQVKGDFHLAEVGIVTSW
jgi:hypothetical protein